MRRSATYSFLGRPGIKLRANLETTMESEIFIENILYKEVKSFEPPERK